MIPGSAVPRARRRALAAPVASLVIGLAGCASKPQPDDRYAPTQSVLEVVSVLRLHTDDDTYRFPPARDFTGKNVYRASLRRLEALEQIHSAKLRSGYLTDVLLFAKGRALERIGEYELAAESDGEVKTVHVEIGQTVEAGRDLITLGPVEGE